jgi:RNA 3'-terminal phosphate cyclase (ATP)
MISIDGAIGEGGGQILRSCLTLSVVTGQAFTMKNIRARRKKPGLRPQHLSAVQLAAAISDAWTEGVTLGSTHLSFSPKLIKSGTYQCDIGTAGSTSLVLQTVYLPLSLFHRQSDLIITGGTHVPLAPSYDYLNQHWLVQMDKIGFDLRLEMIEAGFYPKGGGKIRGTINPIQTINPLSIPYRGQLIQIRGFSGVANLDRRIAARQKERVVDCLGSRYPINVIRIGDIASKFKGTTLFLVCEFEYSQCCYFSLGAKGKPAEQVADEVCEKIEYFLSTNASIDEYLADQLLLPLSFANGSSSLSTARVSNHLRTNAEVIQHFNVADISISGKIGHPGFINITPLPQ